MLVDYILKDAFLTKGGGEGKGKKNWYKYFVISKIKEKLRKRGHEFKREKEDKKVIGS